MNCDTTHVIQHQSNQEDIFLAPSKLDLYVVAVVVVVVVVVVAVAVAVVVVVVAVAVAVVLLLLLLLLLELLCRLYHPQIRLKDLKTRGQTL